jgi:hypothetical protein
VADSCRAASLERVATAANNRTRDDSSPRSPYVEFMGYKPEAVDNSIYTLRRRIPVRPVETLTVADEPAVQITKKPLRVTLRRFAAAVSITSRQPQST